MTPIIFTTLYHTAFCVENVLKQFYTIKHYYHGCTSVMVWLTTNPPHISFSSHLVLQNSFLQKRKGRVLKWRLKSTWKPSSGEWVTKARRTSSIVASLKGSLWRQKYTSSLWRRPSGVPDSHLRPGQLSNKGGGQEKSALQPLWVLSADSNLSIFLWK